MPLDRAGCIYFLTKEQLQIVTLLRSLWRATPAGRQGWAGGNDPSTWLRTSWARRLWGAKQN